MADAATAVADVVRAGVGKLIPAESARLWARYCADPDPELLSVYADALEKEGDPRGRFIQLSRAGKRQAAARDAMQKKLKGALVGPAKAFLREWKLGPNGLVDRARTDAATLVSNVDAIANASPRLLLTVTAIKTLADAKSFGAISPRALAKVWLIDFAAITGTHATELDDQKLAATAPALAEVERLHLSCRSARSFGPAGLRALGRHLKRVKFLALDYSPLVGLPPASAYARVLAETPGFATLEALSFPQIGATDLSPLRVRLNTVVMTDDSLVPAGPPRNLAAEIEAATKSRSRAARPGL